MAVEKNIKIIEGKNNSIYFVPSPCNLIVGFKYGNNKDFFVEFKKCGVNNLLQMYKFYEADNNEDEVQENVLRDKQILKTAVTDFISPVVVKSLVNDTGYTIKDFTGGWHGYTGGQTGNATAKTSSYVLYLDGVKQNYRDIVQRKVDRIDLKVINYIQAYNTKLENGVGKYVLEETTIYTIIKNTINVSTTLKALENCVIYTYYGLQSSNSHLWNESITYPLGQSKERITFDVKGNSSGDNNRYPNSRRWVVKGKEGHALCCFIDNNFGIGKRQYIDSSCPNSFTVCYGNDINNTKSYSNLIKSYGNDGLHLGKSKMVSWRGGYIFCNVASNATSLDLFQIYNEFNRKRVIFDCVKPCGNFVLDDSLIGKNIKVNINSNNAEITQVANGLSILNEENYGCVELEITDSDI